MGRLPARAPVPRHAEHASWETICKLTVVPSMASMKSIVVSPVTSAPRRDRRAVERADPAPPNRLLKTSPNPSPLLAVRRKSSTLTELVRPPPPGNRNPPPAPKRLRAWSYSLRLRGSDRTSLASEASLNRASAALSPGWESGWLSRAILRNAFLICSGLASLETPNTL